MAQELAIRDSVGGMPAVQTIAQHFVRSGFFKDTRDVSQAVVRILAGGEMGFGPFASMQGVHIIEGKPSVSAGLMATAIEKSGRYTYRLGWEPDDTAPTACAVTFYRTEGGKREPLGVSRFSVDDAKQAGLWDKGGGMWKKYTRNMLFSRAMSNGCRWYCAGVFGVGAVYTPEELGREVDEDGSVVQRAQPAPAGTLSAIRMVAPATAEVELPADEPQPASIDQLGTELGRIAARGKAKATPADKEWLRTLPGLLGLAALAEGATLPDRASVTDWDSGMQWARDAIFALRPT